MEHSVFISEIFHSIQGEGKTVGTPAIFVRFWGCNLRCRFGSTSCDTPYAVIGEKGEATAYTVEQLSQEIRELSSVCKHIIFTGGEPLLYQPFITELIEYLDDGYTYEVETNGTIPVTRFLQLVVKVFNVSVKLENSNQENEKYNKKRINNEALKSFPKHKSYFKFVFDKNTCLDEVDELVEKYKFETYLMPMGATQKELKKYESDTVEACLRNNFNYSPRLHITLWGGKRGK